MDVERWELDKTRSDGTEFYAAELAKAELEISRLVLQLSISSAVAELREQVAWKKLVEDLRGAEGKELERITSAKMSEYDLGKSQGVLRVCRMMTQAEPMKPEVLASIRERVTILRNQVRDYRDLIS